MERCFFDKTSEGLVNGDDDKMREGNMWSRTQRHYYVEGKSFKIGHLKESRFRRGQRRY